MEIFVEQQVIAPIRVALKFIRAAKHWSPSVFVAQKDPAQPSDDLMRHLEQIHQLPRTGRTLDFEIVAVIGEIMQQATNDQRVDGNPDRPAPIRIAAEHAAVRFRRQVADAIFLALDAKGVGVPGMIARQRANPVRAQELVLVKHAAENAPQPVPVDEPDEAPPSYAIMTGSRWVDRLEQ